MYSLEVIAVSCALFFSAACSAEKTALMRFISTDLLNKKSPFLTTALADIDVNDIKGGITNFCYRVTDRSTNKSVFVKHATNYIRGWYNIPLSAERLKYEHDGMLAFSAYSADFVPQIIAYNDDSKHLANEWLEGFTSLRQCFVEGSFDASYARKMGTLMGRSHARTHREVAPNKIQKYSTVFTNQEHLDMWVASMFEPLEKLLSENCVKGVEDDASFKHHIQSLKEVYLHKKQALVHADLHCNNVLIDLTAGDGDESFKVVDFEKCYFGPAGLDLGLFLSNYLFYYAAHPNPAARRSLSGGASAVLEAYRSAFVVQAMGARREQHQDELDLEALLDEILRDAAGFMGLFPLFLLEVIPDVAPSLWPLDEVVGMSFGNVQDRQDAVRRRQLRMAIQAIKLYGGVEPVTFQKLMAVLLNDDKYLSTEQLTEFWF